jgi:hypothetical protein
VCMYACMYVCVCMYVCMNESVYVKLTEVWGIIKTSVLRSIRIGIAHTHTHTHYGKMREDNA